MNLSSRFRVYNDAKGKIGTVYTSVVHNNDLYLGTNQGLFKKSNDSSGDFDFVEGTSGQVWALKVIDDQLFCGHDLGTLVVATALTSLAPFLAIPPCSAFSPTINPVMFCKNIKGILRWLHNSIK